MRLSLELESEFDGNGVEVVKSVDEDAEAGDGCSDPDVAFASLSVNVMVLGSRA